ncbi:MAG: mechanosensitive ion channel domain-containing protein [Polyangia bacterium]
MALSDRVHEILFHPLIHLAAGPLTLASILLALLIIVVSHLVSLAIGRGVRRVLHHRGVHDGAGFAMGKIVRYILLLIGVMIAITSIGLKMNALLAASAALFVGIGFGLQTIAQNFISGVILLIERPVAKGDFVQIGETSGTVSDIGLRATRVVTRDEVTIIVPNSDLVTKEVINHSVPTPRRRLRVEVGVAYGSDVEKVVRALQEVSTPENGVLADPPAEIRLERFSDSSLDFALLAWIEDPSQDMRISSNLRFAIERTFRTYEITIPFPQREVSVRGTLKNG